MRAFLASLLYVISAQSALAVDQFSLAPVTGAPLGIAIHSNQVTVSGAGFPAPISIIGGEYAIANQQFTATPGTVGSFTSVQVRATSAASPGATTKATHVPSGDRCGTTNPIRSSRTVRRRLAPHCR